MMVIVILCTTIKGNVLCNTPGEVVTERKTLQKGQVHQKQQKNGNPKAGKYDGMGIGESCCC